jgi:hypothetical protein
VSYTLQPHSYEGDFAMAIGLVVFVIVAVIAAVAVRRHLMERTVSEDVSPIVPVAPEGFVYMSIEELQDLQDNITRVFEYGYKSALKGDEFTEEDGVIYILRNTGTQLIEFSYDPLTNDEPVQLRVRKMPKFIGGQAQNISVVDSSYPQEPPEWAVG